MPDAALTRDEPMQPSPPWYGAVSTALLGLMVAILLTYTLADWEWQQSLGAWNYAAVGVLVVMTSAWMKGGRAARSRNDPAPAGDAAPADGAAADGAAAEVAAADVAAGEPAGGAYS